MSSPERQILLYELFGEEAPCVPRVDMVQIFRQCEDFDSLLRFADTVRVNNTPAEGIVCKMISDPRISFKVLSNKYLLKHEL